MDLSFINEYFIPIVMAGCLATGYVVKKWIKDVDNKYIPTIMFFEGAILNCVITGQVDIKTIIAGSICGLGSTGLHQAFKQIIEGSNEKA